jgi:zinc protease
VIERPTPTAVRPYQFPGVERSTLANGLRVLVAPMHRLPIVTVLALVDAGASGDPAGQEGLAALTARTLDEGSGALDGAALTERFEALGTSFDATADWDSTVARVTVTPNRLDAALSLFAQVLRTPRFPEADVERKRDERLDDLAQALAEPRGLADMRFTGLLYTGARFGRPAGGNAASVAGLDAAAVRGFHAAQYRPERTTLIVVGDITTDAAIALALAKFGDWKGAALVSDVSGTNARNRELDAAAANAKSARSLDLADARRRTMIITKPDAPQTELRLGHAGVPRRHPDHLAIVVMNAILGGLFSSRINLNLREKNAFTYGASSAFDWRRAAGPFVVSTAVKTEVTSRAVEEILREIDGMRAAAPSESELSLATDYLAGVFPLRFETTSAVAGALAGAVVFDLTDEWFREYRERVQAITSADVLRVAQQHLDPSRLLLVAVGDAAQIEAPLRALKHGSLEVLSASHDPSETQ